MEVQIIEQNVPSTLRPGRTVSRMRRYTVGGYASLRTSHNGSGIATLSIDKGVIEALARNLGMEYRTAQAAASAVDADLQCWVTPDHLLPADFDTVLGHMAKRHPEALRLMVDPVEGTLRDGYWLKACAKGRVVKVPAPKALRERGIETVNAYPRNLLRRRMGA